MAFELTILGSNSAVPAYGRHLSAQVVTLGSESFLIDCGEGTQMQMMKYQIKMHKINRIFISHLHGDHIFGLIGLLMTYGLNGREKPLHIYSPKGLQPILNIQLQRPLTYPLHFHTTDPEKFALLFENETAEVYSIPLVHGVPCHGFLFAEKQAAANMRKDKIKEYKIPYQQIPAIKAGADYVTETGLVIPHSELTLPAAAPCKFAYCSDTMYSEAIVPLIEGVDLLYHEATFMHDLLHQAQSRMHSTAYQAASIAKQANVKRLIIGHFSSRYQDLTPLKKEAQTVFKATSLAIEGEKIKVKN
ncbi:ribonuclease Z [Aureispira anguillae]|uniref:Ribonuclease Z n=1 Tax=Aureispira anguillae TaxID=2864201 RepID=A0A915YIU4_9BACT|nr:ribonuclease Z [Aureispira anguillae]BDS13804.1 ribonuclease Z [Aureispira anguillae]